MEHEHIHDRTRMRALPTISVIICIVMGIGIALGNASNPGGAATSAATAATMPVVAVIRGIAKPVQDQRTLNQAGVDMLKQGRCEEAMSQFQTAYEVDPTAYGAYEPLNNMAFCLYDLNRNAEAIARWRQALGIEPNSPDANAGLGLALYVAGQQDEGLIFYRKAVGLQAGYLDEGYLRDSVFWSVHAVEASRPLRERLESKVPHAGTAFPHPALDCALFQLGARGRCVSAPRFGLCLVSVGSMRALRFRSPPRDSVPGPCLRGDAP